MKDTTGVSLATFDTIPDLTEMYLRSSVLQNTWNLINLMFYRSWITAFIANCLKCDICDAALYMHLY